MSTPALTTTIVATETVPLTIPILVGYTINDNLLLTQSVDHCGKGYVVLLDVVQQGGVVAQVDVAVVSLSKHRGKTKNQTGSSVATGAALKKVPKFCQIYQALDLRKKNLCRK